MNPNAACSDQDVTAYLNRHIRPTSYGATTTLERYPCPRLVFPSGATGVLTVEPQGLTTCIVIVTPHYEPRVEDTHPDDVRRITEAVEALRASMPHRFERPIATIALTYQGGAQYEMTREDGEWVTALIDAVCPVGKRWVGRAGGGVWCVSHAVDPRNVRGT